MSSFPTTTFDGYLKQIDTDQLGSDEASLFDLLFPSFRPKTVPDKEDRLKKDREQAAFFAGYVEVHYSTTLPRRFAGYNFPRRRYYSLAMNELHHVDQTLAHELRAYRNPRDIGYIDVLDLGSKTVTIVFETPTGKISESVEPENAIAVLIHDLETLPAVYRQLCLKTFPSKDGGKIGFFKFPYTILRYKIKKVIDLRLPNVRDWFYEHFSEIAKNDLQLLKKNPFQLPETTTAYSKFHLENQIPPPMNSFWEMLPTLMNPDLGGGYASLTGSTIHVVATSLQQANVAAFIYPSARADVNVSYKNGEMIYFSGWNLVDYRGADARYRNVEVSIADHSPWCWQRLPEGVILRIAEKGSEVEGSFEVEGMINYHAMHYMTQCRAVKHLKKHIPRIFQDGFVLKLAKPYLVWKLGTRSTRWLRHFLRQGDIKLRQWDIKHDLFDTFGCAVLLGVYDHVGLLDDLSNAKRKDDSWFKTAHMTNVRIASSLRRNITGQNKNNPLGANIRLAQNLERCLLDLSILVFSPKGSLQDQNSIGKTVPRLKEDIHFFTDINQNMRQELEQFFNAFASVMNDESNSMEVTDLLKEGEELSDRILRFLLEKVSIN